MTSKPETTNETSTETTTATTIDPTTGVKAEMNAEKSADRYSTRPAIRDGNCAAIELRPATAADIDLLRHWDEQPHVVASDPNDDWHWEEELVNPPDGREQLIAEIDGRPLGFVQVMDPARDESRYWGDVVEHMRAIDIWIGEAADLGKGYGTSMMRLALARCFEDSAVSAVLIDPLASNVRAHRFYERLGFRFVERRHFGDDDCFVYRLSREEFAT